MSSRGSVHLTVVGPLSGSQEAMGLAMRRGAELAVERINEAGGVGQYLLQLDFLDDEGNPEKSQEVARRIVQEGQSLMVLGGASSETAQALGEELQGKNIPFVILAPGGEELVSGNDWAFKTSLNDWRQARFMANYNRNVLGRKLVTIVSAETPFGSAMAKGFQETYERFGTSIFASWVFTPGAGAEEKFIEIVTTLKEKQDLSTLYLAMGSLEAARFIKLLRENKLRNPVVGPDTLANTLFVQELVALVGEETATDYLHDTYVTSSLLWDTAGEVAQEFKNRFITKVGRPPDWVATQSFDAIHMAILGLRKGIVLDDSQEKAKEEVIPQGRQGIRDFMANHNATENAFPGVSGTLYFEPSGEVQRTILVGRYDGKDRISALTQLEPIRKKGQVDYLEEIKNGRMLYVNDRFMYKTNVVYTGITLKDVSDIKHDEHTAQMEFLIWFRYAGNFNPANVEFLNAVEPVVLGDPVEENTRKDLIFKLYSVKGRFFLNALHVDRPYGSDVMGISYQHKSLNRNNLVFVVDELGMAGQKRETLAGQIQDSKALNSALELRIRKAWISSETTLANSKGRPQYVGYGTEEPLFSRMDFGVLAEPDKVSLRDVMADEYFVYLTIFSFIGILFAVGIDLNARGMFWSLSSFALHAVFWPLFVISLGQIILDLSVNHLVASTTDHIVMVYSGLLWFLPSRLGSVAIERFIWKPLEQRTERIIPNIIRLFVGSILYLLSTFGIVAFVLDEKLTSLLATGGLLTMIIGLAIQANIANIFSGIIVNIERPFSIGDWIKVGELDDAQVIDITWRTMRLRTIDGHVISIPNGSASESSVINYTAAGDVQIRLPIFFSPDYAPRVILNHLEAAAARFPRLSEVRPANFLFMGVANVDGMWAARYEAWIWLEDFNDKAVLAGFWDALWSQLRVHDISLGLGEPGAPASESASNPLGSPQMDRASGWMANYLEEVVV